MMDDNTTSCSAAPTTTASQDQISLLFAAAPPSHEEKEMPFSSSSYYPLERGSGGEDSGAGSEEGLDVPEEPAKSVPHRSSGSKRSRAAEVHNLSEKRRRSRINEKMKALQNLIPNSNKTDKASMLDEAIEYLKQLQLQVQMLSMRNGLAHPMYLPGSLLPMQASQLCVGFGDSTSEVNMDLLGMLSLNQDSSAHNSFDLTSQCMSSRQPVILPTTGANISTPETSFGMESSQSHHQSFQLRVPSEEIFKMVSQQQLDSGRTTTNLAENEMKTLAVSSSFHFGGQASSSMEHNDHLENVLPKDHPDDSQIFVGQPDGQEGVSSTVMSSRRR